MARDKGTETRGNTIASQAAYDRYVYAHGVGVVTMEHLFHKHREAGLQVKALRFKAPGVTDGEWMVIVTATLDKKPVVAFVFGDGFPECLKSLAARWKNGSLKWKEDQYG